jgi:hypothetical protein
LEKLTVVLIAAPAGVRVEGLKLQPTPEGRPEQLKLTVPAKAFTGVTVSLADAGVDLVSVPLVGLIVSEKSGGGAADMVTVTVLEVEAEKALLPPY